MQYITDSPTHTYATIIDVCLRDYFDVLDIELDLELDQRRQVPICHKEPIRIFLAQDDSLPPYVISIRDDFPVGMVHTNLERDVDGGVSLCIWEEEWSDLAPSLTGQTLIERIRAWFASMAAGTIHETDQFLEPLIHTGSNTLVIPSGEVQGPLYVDMAYKHGDCWIISASKNQTNETILDHPFTVYSPHLPSQVHSGLAKTPYDLGALQHLCQSLGFDLVKGLATWLLEPDQLKSALRLRPLLIITIPKRRADDESDEQLEVWCYTLGETVDDLGERLGVTITEAGLTTSRLFSDISTADLSSIRMDPWRVVQRLDRSTARRFSGSCREHDIPLLAIGAGVIGSNVTMIATRSGLGPWVVVDEDLTLPHNTVRQVQRDGAVGLPKALVLQHELDSVLAEGGNTSISVNVFTPGDHAPALDSALRTSEIAIDFSASPAVLGWLSDQPVKRAVSTFFGPDGADLVVLSEGPSRETKIEEIEAQYFWAVATEERLKDHLVAARMDRIRYANACQDLSRPLPPWQTQTLCGLAAGRISQLIDEADASFRVWRLETGSGAIESICVAVHPVRRFQTGEMRVTTSGEVVQTMREHRRQSGRNETGGVLLGTYDLVRNVVHIVAALPAPPDSKQAPTYFIRGIKDLKPRIERLAEASAGRLHYIGEWHSHPSGVPARPSDDDEHVYAHLKTHMESTGSPFVMAICGERDTWLRAGWQERGILEGVITYEQE